MFVRGVVLCLVSSTCFGLSAIFAKEAYAAGASVPTTLVGRFGVAAVVLWAIVYVRRTALPSPRLVLVCVALGLAYALQAALYFGALAEIDASLAVLLVYTYPALTMVLAVALRRESPDKRRTAALLVSGAGLVLLLDAGAVVGTAGTLGVLLALGAALCYAVYLTAAEAQPAGLDLFVLTAIVCTTSTVALAVWGAVTGSLAVPGAAAATWIVVLATVSTVVPLVVLLFGIRAVGASTAAILSCFEPAVVVAVAAVLYGERLSAVQLVGGAVVLASVLILRARRPGRRAGRAASRVVRRRDPVGEAA
ncbi:DMT family transporter [Virgisporangium ochraceum]|uniref:EamA family transporter n=1 Tax=Virgisporangium ochraceum TaxID=65505 RepID=A0A8J3ZQ70_9ACTN|nr:DMT family transporter [Virgisporangium ochraceum]GIJ67904.1 EamA family transporter [Virgisporangium ochraceum]